MLYRDDFEAARARAEALDQALARSLSRLATEGTIARLEQRLAHTLSLGNWVIGLSGLLGVLLGGWLALGAFR